MRRAASMLVVLVIIVTKGAMGQSLEPPSAPASLLPSLAVSQGDRWICCEFFPNKKPLWQNVVNLPQELEERCALSLPNPDSVMAYTDPQTIVAGFHLESCRTAHTNFIDLIIQIDARTGQELKRVEWPDISRKHNWAGDIDVMPTHDGQFLVKIGPFLKLFSSEFNEINSRVLITDIGPRDYWTVQVAPGGRSGFFKRGNLDDGVSHDHWFSTDTLDDEFVEKASAGENRGSVASASAVYFTPRPEGGYISHGSLVHARERGQIESRPLCAACYGSPIKLVPKGMVFLETLPRASFTLVSAGGQIVHRASFGDDIDSSATVVGASEAPFFALGFGHLRHRIFRWRSLGTIVVFDTNQMKDVFQLKFNQQVEHVPANLVGALPSFALSPDGTRLALLSHSLLKVFEVTR